MSGEKIIPPGPQVHFELLKEDERAGSPWC